MRRPLPAYNFNTRTFGAIFIILVLFSTYSIQIFQHVVTKNTALYWGSDKIKRKNAGDGKGSVRVLDEFIEQNNETSLDILFKFMKNELPTDTHAYGEQITNITEESARCKRFGFEYKGRETRRRIFFGSLIADESWHAILVHAAEAHGLYHSVSFIESNATTSQDHDQSRQLRFGPGSTNLKILQSGVFGPATNVTVDLYIDRPDERSDFEVWNGVEIMQRDLITRRWRENGMTVDDVGIVSDLDEMYSRDFLLAAQSCDIPQFRPNQDCRKPKVIAQTLIFESSPECSYERRRWYHPDMVVGECIEMIGNSTLHKPGKRAWNGVGPREKGYGDTSNSYENMPNISMYPLWRAQEIRGMEGGEAIRADYSAFHLHNFFTSIDVLRNKYLTYSHPIKEAMVMPLGKIHDDLQFAIDCIMENTDEEEDNGGGSDDGNDDDDDDDGDDDDNDDDDNGDDDNVDDDDGNDDDGNGDDGNDDDDDAADKQESAALLDGPEPVVYEKSVEYRLARHQELREMIIKDMKRIEALADTSGA